MVTSLFVPLIQGSIDAKNATAERLEEQRESTYVDAVAYGFPHVFIDRSLGAVQVPRLLRAAGFVLTTMREHYGEQQGQRVQDVDWITLTAQRNWIGFHKDDHIRRNEVERQTVMRVAARMFCISSAEITAQDAANRYIANFKAIAAAARQAGPFIYAVHPRRIERLL